jgi:hypothetical protein
VTKPATKPPPALDPAVASAPPPPAFGLARAPEVGGDDPGVDRVSLILHAPRPPAAAVQATDQLIDELRDLVLVEMDALPEIREYHSRVREHAGAVRLARDYAREADDLRRRRGQLRAIPDPTEAQSAEQVDCCIRLREAEARGETARKEVAPLLAAAAAARGPARLAVESLAQRLLGGLYERWTRRKAERLGAVTAALPQAELAAYVEATRAVPLWHNPVFRDAARELVPPLPDENPDLRPQAAPTRPVTSGRPELAAYEAALAEYAAARQAEQRLVASGARPNGDEDHPLARARNATERLRHPAIRARVAAVEAAQRAARRAGADPDAAAALIPKMPGAEG